MDISVVKIKRLIPTLKKDRYYHFASKVKSYCIGDYLSDKKPVEYQQITEDFLSNFKQLKHIIEDNTS
jgi:hypothetical protein